MINKTNFIFEKLFKIKVKTTIYTICFTAAAGTILTTIYLLVKAHKNKGEAYIAFLHQAEVYFRFARSLRI